MGCANETNAQEKIMSDKETKTPPHVKLRIEMPADAAERLLQAYYADPEKMRAEFAAAGFPLLDMELTECSIESDISVETHGAGEKPAHGPVRATEI